MIAPIFAASSELASQLVGASRACHARGWALATSSNFSARIDAGTILLTASGLDKGTLTEQGLLRVDLDGVPLAGEAGRPSHETALHTSLYRRSPSVGAVLHVHSPAAIVLSALAREAGEVRLEGWELLRALEGVATHEHTEIIPVVDNDQDIPRLASRAGDRLERSPGAHAYLIAGHGLFTWGRSVANAMRHVEALELLFDSELRRMMVRGAAR